MKKKVISWRDYLYMGMAFATMLSLHYEYQDGVYHLLLIALFFCVLGLRRSIRELKEFVCLYPAYAVVTLIWVIYHGFFNTWELVSYRYPIVIFFMVFMGYQLAKSNKDKLMRGIEILWMWLFVLLSVGVINYLLVRDFDVRMNMFFMHPIAEGDAAVVLLLLSLFFMSDVKKKIGGIIVAFAVGITGSLRMSTAIMAGLLVVFSWINRKDVLKRLKDRKNRRLLIIGGIVVILLGLIAITKLKDHVVVEKIVNKYIRAISSITRDAYYNWDADGSYRVRVIAPDQAINVLRRNSFLGKLLGGGVLYGYYSIQPTMTLFSGAIGSGAGPIETTFASILSDFGMAALILYIGMLLCAIKTAFATKDIFLKKMAITVVTILLISGFVDMEYWINLVFFVWMFIGIFLRETENGRERYMLPAMICSSAITLLLVGMPFFYPFIRTAISISIWNQMKSVAIICGILFLLGLFLTLWSISTLVAGMILHKKIQRRNWMTLLLSTVIMVSVAGIVFTKIQSKKKVVKEEIESDKNIILAVKDKAEGDIYTDYFPLFYKEAVEGISSTLFSGASLAATPNATVIMQINDEAYFLIKSGFLYQPISDNTAIYTNDPGAISALKDMGYNPKGYYSTEKHIDLETIAEHNALLLTDTGAIRNDGKNDKITVSAEDFIYWGKQVATYRMRVQKEPYSDDYVVCDLLIKQQETEKELASTPIWRSMFDENGELTYELPFSGGAKCDFEIIPHNNTDLEISAISYRANPDYDTHVLVNTEGRVIHEEYFDLDGNPIEIQAGFHGVEYSYNDYGDWTRKTLLGMDNKPIIAKDGYAEIRRALDDRRKIVREEYYDDNGMPIKLADGQAAVEYEYDEAGNRTVERYYDDRSEPVLYKGQYWYVRRTFNDDNRNIREEYLGKDDQPITLSDGAAGYAREYDEAGNVTVTTYLGADGKPMQNASGFAIMKRAYDGNKRIIREEYYDVNGDAIALESGQAAIEYEYDEGGNRTVDRYYDMDNNPVLCRGQFWYVRRTYNEKRQNIQEMFYGVDDQPVILGDGASGYGREYDEVGNVTMTRYLGTDGNLILNTSGYAIRRSFYDDARRVIREEYFDKDDAPVLCNGEFASQDIRYDDVGAVAGRIYYDLNGDVVREE